MPKLRLFLYIYRGYQFFTSLILSFAHLSAKHVSQPPQIPLSGFSLGLTRFLHVYVPKIFSSISHSGCSQNGKVKWNFFKLFNHVEKSYMKKTCVEVGWQALLFATTKQNKALITVLLQTTKHSEYRVRMCAVCLCHFARFSRWALCKCFDIFAFSLGHQWNAGSYLALFKLKGSESWKGSSRNE